MSYNNERGSGALLVFSLIPFFIVAVYVKMAPDATIESNKAEYANEQFVAAKVLIHNSVGTIVNYRRARKAADESVLTCDMKDDATANNSTREVTVGGMDLCIEFVKIGIKHLCDAEGRCMSLNFDNSDAVQVAFIDNRSIFEKSKEFVKNFYENSIPYLEIQTANAFRTRDSFLPTDPATFAGITTSVAVTPAAADCNYLYKAATADKVTTADHGAVTFEAQQLCRQCMTDAQINTAEVNDELSVECVDVQVCAKQSGVCAAGEFFTQKIGLVYQGVDQPDP